MVGDNSLVSYIATSVTALTYLFFSIKSHVEPLAITVNVAQSSSIQCDQVFLLLAKLYHIYHKLVYNETKELANFAGLEHPVVPILKNIEKH